MLTTIRKRLQSDEGFTLVELLVVILIIGILAAIAIPSFLNQKGKGEDAAAKSAAREASTAMETYYTDTGSYAAADVPKLRAIEGTLPTAASGANSGNAIAANAADTGLLYAAPTGQGYTIHVWSKPSGRLYSIIKADDGTINRSCKVLAAGDSAGGCKNVSGTTGSW